MPAGMKLHGIITGTSPATAADAAVGDVLHGLAKYDALSIMCEVQGATADTLDLYLQSSWDGGTTWWDYAHLPQLGAGAAAIKYAIQVPSMLESTITVIGKGASPALAAGDVIGGPWGPAMRLFAVTGASTSAGAAQTITVHGFMRTV